MYLAFDKGFCCLIFMGRNLDNMEEIMSFWIDWTLWIEPVILVNNVRLNKASCEQCQPDNMNNNHIFFTFLGGGLGNIIALFQGQWNLRTWLNNEYALFVGSLSNLNYKPKKFGKCP